MQVTEHLSRPVTALAALTFSDWMLKGVDEAILESIYAMTQSLQDETLPTTEVARAAAVALEGKTLEEIERAWTQAFCVGDGSVTPHESVAFTGLVMQEPRDEVLEFMHECGVTLSADTHEPADHLGVMLAFLARLLVDDQTQDKALEFAEKHLHWVPWVRKELARKQPDNAIVPVLLTLLEAVLEDFVVRAQRL